MNITRQTIKLFWQHGWRYPRYVIGVALMPPIIILVHDFGAPYILSQVLDQISRGAYNPADIWGSFGSAIALYIPAIYGTNVLGWRIQVWLEWQLELRVTQDLATRVFNHLINQSADFHANRFGGSLVSQTNKLLGAYVRFADTTTFNLYTLILAMIYTLIFLTPRVPLYSLALGLLTTLYIGGSILIAKRMQSITTAEAQAQSEQTGYLADSITNVMAVKSFAGNHYEADRFYDVTQHTRNAGKHVLYAFMKRDTYMSTITGTLTITALLIAIFGASALHANLATLFLIVNFTANISQRLWDFNAVLRNYNRALGDAADMVQILQIQPTIQDPAQPEPARITGGAIHFNHVTFTHPEAGESLFADLDLAIKSGEKIGLVGHSGSGKTTLTKLLLRFSDIDDGEILIDGQDITHITQADLRRAIAYVPQEPLLFHRTIRENIGYGKPNATEQEIAEAARKANAAEFIEKLPHGYGTLVGERGVKLSGGQRQRIVIARAILKDAPILVLDEATSALDSASEQLIQKALAKLMEHRTAIVIAHRLSTVQKMDRIVVLDDGNIVEQGSHRDLLDRGGVYAQLWSHQSGGFIED